MAENNHPDLPRSALDTMEDLIRALPRHPEMPSRRDEAADRFRPSLLADESQEVGEAEQEQVTSATTEVEKQEDAEEYDSDDEGCVAPPGENAQKDITQGETMPAETTSEGDRDTADSEFSPRPGPITDKGTDNESDKNHTTQGEHAPRDTTSRQYGPAQDNTSAMSLRVETPSNIGALNDDTRSRDFAFPAATDNDWHEVSPDTPTDPGPNLNLDGANSMLDSIDRAFMPTFPGHGSGSTGSAGTDEGTGGPVAWNEPTDLYDAERDYAPAAGGVDRDSILDRDSISALVLGAAIYFVTRWVQRW